MKRIFFYLLAGMMMPMFAQEYVDLGLSSATLWKSANEEGLYSFDEATAKFNYTLPSFGHWAELRYLCEWEWVETGYKVTGPNGNFIMLPNDGMKSCDGQISSVGLNGFYWSRTSYNAEKAYGGIFYVGRPQFAPLSRCAGYAVRLIQGQFPPAAKFVDLGLPSGTLWKDANEPAIFYSYEEAKSKYGDQVPTQAQWEELLKQCTWTWTGRGYEVKGKNGNSIFLYAGGFRSPSDGMVIKVGKNGNYLSSTKAEEGNYFIKVYFDEGHKFVEKGSPAYEFPLRLVQTAK
jgi:hypothetical protein